MIMLDYTLWKMNLWLGVLAGKLESSTLPTTCPISPTLRYLRHTFRHLRWSEESEVWMIGEMIGGIGMVDDSGLLAMYADLTYWDIFCGLQCSQVMLPHFLTFCIWKRDREGWLKYLAERVFSMELLIARINDSCLIKCRSTWLKHIEAFSNKIYFSECT